MWDCWGYMLIGPLGINISAILIFVKRHVRPFYRDILMDWMSAVSLISYPICAIFSNISVWFYFELFFVAVIPNSHTHSTYSQRLSWHISKLINKSNMGHLFAASFRQRPFAVLNSIPAGIKTSIFRHSISLAQHKPSVASFDLAII